MSSAAHKIGGGGVMFPTCPSVCVCVHTGMRRWHSPTGLPSNSPLYSVFSIRAPTRSFLPFRLSPIPFSSISFAVLFALPTLCTCIQLLFSLMLVRILFLILLPVPSCSGHKDSQTDGSLQRFHIAQVADLLSIRIDRSIQPVFILLSLTLGGDFPPLPFSPLSPSFPLVPLRSKPHPLPSLSL